MKRLTALACLLALAFIGAAPAGLSPDAQERFAGGLAALKSGDWATAAQELSDPSLASTPLAEYALLLQAEGLLGLGDTPAARTAAIQATDTDGALAPSALLRAARVLSDAGDGVGAAGLLRRFLTRYPDHPGVPRARYLLGEALLSGGDTREAARIFHLVWVLTPASSYAEEASRQLRVLADTGITVPVPTQGERVDRAERLLGAGLMDAARTEAEVLVAEGASGELLLRALRIVMEASRRTGRDEGALVAANQGLAAAPAERRAAWLLDLARLQQRRSRDEALATLDRLIRDHPKSTEAPEALMFKARLLEGAARQADAEAVYTRVAAGYPDGDEGAAALWRLGWFAWFRGSHDRSTSSWNRLLAIPAGQPYREAATYWLGRSYERRGEMAQAVRQFSQLARDAPRTYYGLLASRRGLRGSGAAKSPPALPSLPADPLEPLQADARFVKVEALRSVGLQDYADEEMEDMTRRSLGEPRRLYALSAAYAQESRYHLALRILRRHFQSMARSGIDSVPRIFWEMFYPLGWRTELSEAASRASVDPYLVAALVREESSFYPLARSRVGARGLMQLMPDTARGVAQSRQIPFRDVAMLDEPGVNLDIGATFFAGLLKEFGDARLAAAAYNAGPARVREWWAARRSDDVEVWVEQIPFNETRGFVKRVMLSWEEYRRLYGGQP